MRVALVCPYDLSVPGGVQNQSIGLANALCARGHVVMLLAPGEARPHELDDAVGLALVGRSLGVPVNGSIAPVSPSPLTMLRTRARLSGFRADVVHVQEPFVPGPALAALLAARAPVVGTFHRAGAGRAYRALRPLLVLLNARLAAAVAVSSEAASTARAVLGASLRIEVLYNAVSIERFAAARAAREAGDLAGEPKQAARVVFLGRLEHRKGLDVLLEAFEQLGGDAELLVIGDGPEGARLRGHAGAAVRFLGRLPDAEVAQVLISADVFVAPSLFGESFGVVLLEAMAAGCPVVASDLAGYRLAGGDAARYVPAGDAPALAKVLHELLQGPSERAALVHAGSARVTAFSFDQLARAYEAVYQRVSHS